MTRVVCLLLICGLMLPGASAAQQDAPPTVDYAHPGFYLSFLGLGAVELFDEPSGVEFSNGGGFNVRAGFRINPHFAAEMQFEYVEGFSDGPIDIEIWNLMWNAKGYLLTGRLQPFALFGMGVMNGDVSARGFSSDDDDFAIRLAGGLDVYLTRSWVFTLESAFIQPANDLDDLSYATFGAGIQFRY